MLFKWIDQNGRNPIARPGHFVHRLPAIRRRVQTKQSPLCSSKEVFLAVVEGAGQGVYQIEAGEKFGVRYLICHLNR